MKKLPQTDAIFENVFAHNQASDSNPNSLGLSIDTKAKVKIGNLSRGGQARGKTAKTASDHDTQWLAQLVPFGILNTDSDELSIYFGQSAETSDFIVDCLEDWWHQHQLEYAHIDEWVIDLDGGSATRSNRTQFIKRMVELARAFPVTNPIDLLSSRSQ
ncbi:MAG: transposase [Cyanobacteriota bacterium]|nr:transposase [Cyanobacteriota bacterium]